MRRVTTVSVGWVLVLICSLTLSACGGDEHKDHKNMGTGTQSPK